MRIRKLIVGVSQDNNVTGKAVEGVHVVAKKIGMPTFKSNVIEVPGANGSLDLSDVLTGGFPRYGNRAVSFDLVLVDTPGSPDVWATMRKFGIAWHGQIVKVTTDDAADSFFQGRATIAAFADDVDGVKFTLALDAEPYRQDFIETAYFLRSSSGEITFDVGDMPLSPIFDGAPASLVIDGASYTLTSAQIPGLALSPGLHTLTLTSDDPLTMTYRAGRM